MTPHDQATSLNRALLEVTEESQRIRRYSTHAVDQWIVEIFREPTQNSFLARVAGLPGLIGQGSTEAESVNRLCRQLGRG